MSQMPALSRHQVKAPSDATRRKGGRMAEIEQDYVAFRPLLFSIAYRMTGSVADAEDIVSEAFVRFQLAKLKGQTIASPKTYLSTITTRLSIDHLRLARVHRERYVGTWLPEPLLDDGASDFTERVELADSLSMAFLVLLESLAPTERAVFLLHDVFEFDYARIARIVDKSEANCRQLAVRARRHVDERRPRFEASRHERDELAERFFAAVEDGDTEGLVALLSADVIAYGDGGGAGPSLPRPVHGRDRVIRLLSAVTEAIRRYGLRIERGTVNGQPGAVLRDADGRLLNVLSIDVTDGRVQTFRSILNPDKLRHLSPLIGPEHPLRGGARVSLGTRAARLRGGTQSHRSTDGGQP